jgi:hypothetical protein
MVYKKEVEEVFGDLHKIRQERAINIIASWHSAQKLMSCTKLVFVNVVAGTTQMKMRTLIPFRFIHFIFRAADEASSSIKTNN